MKKLVIGGDHTTPEYKAAMIDYCQSLGFDCRDIGAYSSEACDYPLIAAEAGRLVASGEADVYYRTGYTMEWDTAAMQAVVENAGGIFLQLDDSSMRYNRKNSLNAKGFYILNKIENKFD
jgi:fructose-1,6-bisphosphatase/inositol monophosphatase family enzyme